MSPTSAYSSPDGLGRVGRTAPEAVVWVRVSSVLGPHLAGEWLSPLGRLPLARRAAARMALVIGRLIGLPREVSVPVGPAPLGVGLAIHSLSRALLRADSSRIEDDGPPIGALYDAFEAVLEGWLPSPLPAVLRRMPLRDAVASVLHLLDGEVRDVHTEASKLPADATPSPDWLFEIARFAEGAGLSVAEALETVPWRAFPDEAKRTEVLRALRVRDAALAAASGFGGGEAAEVIQDAVARAMAQAGLNRRPPATPETVRANIRRLAGLFKSPQAQA